MDLSPGLIVGGLFVGFVVGLTGMGGGALMTPMLVFFFKIDPLTAVSSDLVVSAIMKPVGSVVHIRQRTVNWGIMKWLAIGSVPAAFSGVFVLKLLGNGDDVQDIVKKSLGIALCLAAGSLIYKSYITMTARARRSRGEAVTSADVNAEITVRPLPTLIVGVLGGLVVGMTSVGSGSMIIIALMALYPTLAGSRLVGTDLVQAVPLVAAAALGHILKGDFQFTVAAPLVLGAVPGVYVGARLSSSAPSGLIRRALGLVLLASALKLLDVPNGVTVAVLAALVLAGPPLWAWARHRQGLPRRSIVEDLLPWLAARRGATDDTAQPEQAPVTTGGKAG